MSRLIRSLRFALSTVIWRVGNWLSGRRRTAATAEQTRRHAFGLRGTNVRMNDRVRDAFRADWLHVRRGDRGGD